MGRLASAVAEGVSLLLLPAALVVCALLDVAQSGLLTLAACVAGLIVFFAGWEASEGALRQVMPPVVLAAVATVGRIACAALPNIQPVTAVCVMAGAIFGRRSGFMTGALAGVASSVFLGFGAWTPWQMYAWGLVGYLAGAVFHRKDAAAEPGRFMPFAVCAFGAIASILFGAIMNTWMIIGFMHPNDALSVTAVYASGAVLDIAHAVSTAVFLALLYVPWGARLRRLSVKYGM